MKIGIDGRLWQETGVGRYIRNLVWGLEKIDKKNNYVLFLKKGFKIKELGFKNTRWKIVETSVHWHSFKEQLHFPKQLYQENLDLMHFPYFSLPVFYNRPFVVTIHDLIINHFATGKASTLPYPLYRVKRIGYDVVMKHAIDKSQRIIVPLYAVQDDVIQTFGVPKKKIAVTYEGVEKMAHGKLHMKNSFGKYFLYVGNAYPHKNLDRLLDAFILFREKKRAEVALVLVGKDDFFFKRLHKRVKQQQIENVHFKHNVSDEVLASLYANARAFVSPSLMEGFGLPPLEAMSFSCPLLLADNPAFREVCGDIAWYFKPSDVSLLTEKLEFMYNLDHKKKQEHLAKGRARVQTFSWEQMTRETIQVYESSVSIRSSE